VLLTADRPAPLRGTQANQTTDQVRVFGSATRGDADVPPGNPDHDQAAQVAAWRDLACRALAVARGGTGSAPGPVQLNLQLSEPLVPGLADGWVVPVDGRPGDAAWQEPAPVAEPGPSVLEPGPRTVVVAGDDAGPPARILAERHGWPLFAEPTSGSRTGENAIRTYRLLLGDPDLAGRIERVVVCGHPTLSRPVTRLISSPDVEVVAVRNATGFTDPGHRVSRVLDWPVHVEGGPRGGPRDDTGDGTGDAAPDGSWLAEWKERDARRGRELDALLAGRDGLTPHQVAGAVAAALPPDGLLFVGASNPVRDLDLMVPRYRVGDRRLVIGNRGLAGIDGCVSTAVGAALGRPRSSRAFALLEQGDPAYGDSYERLFGTPHHVDLASLCAATRTPHWRVDSLPELQQALASPNGGIEIVEAVVGRSDRRELDAAIRGLSG
jgi:2-succinyl-5-enolpyruvyl-6-hydroxy-3-cyclohexene-1-carboxylate synthase